MVFKPQIIREPHSVLLIDQNHILTVVVGFFCQVLLASRYENNNLRASETGDAEDIDSRTNLFTEKSSNQKSDSGVLRPPVGFAFFRIFTHYLSALSYNGGLVWKFRLAIEKIGARDLKPDLDFGRSQYLFFQKMENKTNQSGAQGRNRSRSRNRNRNAGGQNRNNRPGGSNSNRDRNKDRNRQPKIVELTMGQKILKAITFGAIDPNKKKTFPKSTRVQTVENVERQAAARKTSTEVVSERPQKSNREPKVYDVTSARLYVGNLDYNAAESDLEDLFRGVGNVISTEVVTNSRTQQSKGFAFVEMGSLEEARRAVEVLHDQNFMGRKLLVSGAKSEGPRGDEE